MGSVVLVLVVAALIGGVVWNHNNKAAAMEGVEFTTPEPPPVVIGAIAATHVGGAKAKVKSFFSGVRVVPSATQAFLLETKVGDRGAISVEPQGSGSVVRAFTTELYIGSHPKTHMRSGWLGLSSVIGHRLYQLLGIAPNAARMKRFERGLEGRVARHLGRAPSQLQAGADRTSTVLKRQGAPVDATPVRDGAATPAAVPQLAQPRPSWDVPPPAAPDHAPSPRSAEPVLPVEPRVVRAPLLPRAFAADLLASAGFPVTGHNVRAVNERMAVMFFVRGKQFIERLGSPSELARFEESFGRPRNDITLWPQEVLDGIVAWDPAMADQVQELPEQVRSFLLRSAGQPNAFFGGPASTPLPTSGRWSQGA